MTESDERVYTLAEFAESVRISVDQVQKHINGSVPPLLVPGYSGRKPLIRESERQRWLNELPAERVA